MNIETYDVVRSLGFQGTPDTPAKEVIYWLSEHKHVRIEPYWRFLGCTPGFTWSKSWDNFSPRYEVECETWEELLEIALERTLREAF